MENRVRFQMRIAPETDRKIKAVMPLADCQSQNEFVEQALLHYCGCLQAQNSMEILSPALTAAVRGAVQDTENHICRLLFKLTVELSMMMNVLAAGMEISGEDLERLRGRCVQEVKRTNGRISFGDTVRYQNGA